MTKLLMRGRNRLIRLLAGRSAVVLNCEIEGKVHIVSRPWSLINGTTLRAAP